MLAWEKSAVPEGRGLSGDASAVPNEGKRRPQGMGNPREEGILRGCEGVSDGVRVGSCPLS